MKSLNCKMPSKFLNMIYRVQVEIKNNVLKDASGSFSLPLGISFGNIYAFTGIVIGVHMRNNNNERHTSDISIKLTDKGSLYSTK
jgi:hypothetical protein